MVASDSSHAAPVSKVGRKKKISQKAPPPPPPLSSSSNSTQNAKNSNVSFPNSSSQLSYLKAELAHIEKQIYDLETTYLSDTESFGNIFVGWKQYFNNGPVTRSDRRGVKRKQADGGGAQGGSSVGLVANKDRLFSLSSASSPAALFEGRDVNTALSRTIESIADSQSRELKSTDVSNHSQSVFVSKKKTKKINPIDNYDASLQEEDDVASGR